MLELLADLAPDARRVITGNAAANAHMIAINEQLGFTVSHISRSRDLNLTAAI
jgi:hypothetical protein